MKLLINKKRKLFLYPLLVFSMYIAFCYIHPHSIEPRDFEIVRIEKNKPLPIHSNHDITRDIDYLIYALDQAYAGQKVYPKEFADMVSALKNLKLDPEIVSVDTYVNKITHIFNSFPDGHLSAHKSQEEPTLDEDGSLEINQASLDENQKPYNFQIKKINGKKIFIAQISTFMIFDLKEQEKMIASFKQMLAGSQGLIIDLRGNSGGIQELPMEMASILWGEQFRIGSAIQYFKMPIQTSATFVSPVSLALHLNFQVLEQSRYGKHLTDESKKGFWESIFEYNEYGFDSTRKKITRNAYEFDSYVDQDINNLEYSNKNYQKNGYKKKIFLIADKFCASACERMIEALEAHPQFKLAGEHTAGAVQFGNVGYLLLPDSQIHIILATAYIIYSDNRRTERVGYQPSYPISKDKNALAEIELLL